VVAGRGRPCARRQEGPLSAGYQSSGTCFGYEVWSSLAFSFLRRGRSEAQLEIVQGDHHEGSPEDPILEWLPRPGHNLHARLYGEGEGFSFWTDREGWFHIDPSRPLISVPDASDVVRREERIWGIPAMLCFLRRGDLPLHAAAVEVDGRAVLLAAPGRFGKTTLAGAFFSSGYRILAEDIACCRLAPGPAVLPGPSILRVRRDTYRRLGFPGTHTVAEEPERVHLAIDEPLRGDGRPVPLVALVFLRTGDGDGRMERVATVETLSDIWSLSLKLPTDADRALAFERAVTLANQIPVWNLHRALEFGNLPRVVEKIISTCLTS
jgi:hypothetical protein